MVSGATALVADKTGSCTALLGCNQATGDTQDHQAAGLWAGCTHTLDETGRQPGSLSHTRGSAITRRVADSNVAWREWTDRGPRARAGQRGSGAERQKARRCFREAKV